MHAEQAGSYVHLGAQILKCRDNRGGRGDPDPLPGPAQHLEADQLAFRCHPGQHPDPCARHEPAAVRRLARAGHVRRPAGRCLAGDDAGHMGTVPVGVGERRKRIRWRIAGQPDQPAEVTVQRGGVHRSGTRHRAGLGGQLKSAEMRVAAIHPRVDDCPHDAAAAGVVRTPAGVRLDRGCRPVDLRVEHVVRPCLEDGRRRIRAAGRVPVRAAGGLPVPPDQAKQLAPGQHALVKPGRHPLETGRNSGMGRAHHGLPGRGRRAGPLLVAVRPQLKELLRHGVKAARVQDVQLDQDGNWLIARPARAAVLIARPGAVRRWRRQVQIPDNRRAG